MKNLRIKRNKVVLPTPIVIIFFIRTAIRLKWTINKNMWCWSSFKWHCRKQFSLWCAQKCSLVIRLHGWNFLKHNSVIMELFRINKTKKWTQMEKYCSVDETMQKGELMPRVCKVQKVQSAGILWKTYHSGFGGSDFDKPFFFFLSLNSWLVLFFTLLAE